MGVMLMCVLVCLTKEVKNRKQHITTNMLGVVDWNMKFLYVFPSWEGSTSDSGVLCDAMSRQDAFVVPQGMTFTLGNLFLCFVSYLIYFFHNRKILFS